MGAVHRVLVIGALGRMGDRVRAAVAAEPALCLGAALEVPGHPRLGETVENDVRVGDDASVSVRSERLRIFDADGADEESFQYLSATHMETVYLGLTTSELLTLPDGNEIKVRRLSDGAGDAGISRGEGVRILCASRQRIEQLAQDVEARGGILEEGPERHWAGQEFTVVDPDGYRISISTGAGP